MPSTRKTIKLEFQFQEASDSNVWYTAGHNCNMANFIIGKEDSDGCHKFLKSSQKKVLLHVYLNKDEMNHNKLDNIISCIDLPSGEYGDN